jgi:hypothetical protein
MHTVGYDGSQFDGGGGGEGTAGWGGGGGGAVVVVVVTAGAVLGQGAITCPAQSFRSSLRMRPYSDSSIDSPLSTFT